MSNLQKEFQSLTPRGAAWDFPLRPQISRQRALTAGVAAPVARRPPLKTTVRWHREGAMTGALQSLDKICRSKNGMDGNFDPQAAMSLRVSW